MERKGIHWSRLPVQRVVKVKAWSLREAWLKRPRARLETLVWAWRETLVQAWLETLVWAWLETLVWAWLENRVWVWLNKLNGLNRLWRAWLLLGSLRHCVCTFQKAKGKHKIFTIFLAAGFFYKQIFYLTFLTVF